MRISRCFYDGVLAPNETVLLPENTGRYVVQSLRLKKGNPLILFDGTGVDYEAELVGIHKKTVEVFIKTKSIISTESTLTLHLGYVIAKHEKTDLVIQKAVELGVSEISLLYTQRSNIKIPADRLVHRMARWQQIIISACEQSGRAQLPQLNPPIAIESWLSKVQAPIKFVFHPRAEKSLQDFSGEKESSCALLVGCEGGFSDDEITLAQQHDFNVLQFGKRILRTETAAIAGVTAAQLLFGDLC